MIDLLKINEPSLLFGHNQALEDPRDGLTIFGPLQKNPPFGVRYGLIGTSNGIYRFKTWASRIQSEIVLPEKDKLDLWIPYPGFNAAFGIPFPIKPVVEKIVNVEKLEKFLKHGDSYKRVYNVVHLYAEMIFDFYKKSDESLDIWFVISPEEVFRYCRPRSKGANALDFIPGYVIKKRLMIAGEIKRGQELLFEELKQEYEAYVFDNDFRKQLKARLILEKTQTPIQIVRETTLAPDDFLNTRGHRIRDLQPDSQVAWNLLSTVFYKSGGKPWKLGEVREGVCYLGLVFKKLEGESDPNSACCAAQMFLDSGDGVVFKGAVGPWKSSKGEQYHLSREAAKEIANKAVSAYTDFFGKKGVPSEIFIHGKTFLNDEEWKGFTSVVTDKTKIVGVRITHSVLKLFRPKDFPLLRGMAYIEDNKKGYLWTTGFIPRLRTSPYEGVPSPQCIEICKGDSDIKTVLKDILALTKLNYNACFYGDSQPITLSFADKIGDILTAGPIPKDVAPLPFKFYI